MKVLFVCSGNICRSPMAAEYLRHRAAQNGLAHVVVDSAGTLGLEDVPATQEAIGALRDLGLDLAAHRSRGLTAVDLRTSDLVIVMTHEHLEHLVVADPEGLERRFLLRAFEPGPQPASLAPDVPDPIGESIEVYRELFETIRTCVDHLVLHLRHLDPAAGDG